MRHNCVEYAIYAHTIHDDEDDYDCIVVRNLRGGNFVSVELKIVEGVIELTNIYKIQMLVQSYSMSS